ncbi:MAG TPA: ABC-2 transporter permease [Steroidobacteraceae bacterium]|jgi:ABC-2 type transport system permease protein|nr:ABC-2 transporter permease [Steroidobacteraceae bacterium]
MNAKAIVLVRREFWEHRALWLVPLVVAALYLLICLIPGNNLHIGGIDLNDNSRSFGPGRPVEVFAVVQSLFTGMLLSVTSLVTFFYLSDCLYAERKDRSILFWKSLPVSDAETVLSKLLVALLLVPLGVYLLALVTNVVAFGLLYVRFHNNALMQHFLVWDTGVWLRLNLYLVLDVVIVGLWFAPVAAYQLLISAWAKSSVFVWTILPPLLLILAERLAFGTYRIASVIAYRLGTGLLDGDAGAGHVGVESVIARVNLLPVLARVDLWVGVAIAVALVFATIRIRRYRDDT